MLLKGNECMSGKLPFVKRQGNRSNSDFKKKRPLGIICELFQVAYYGIILVGVVCCYHKFA